MMYSPNRRLVAIISLAGKAVALADAVETDWLSSLRLLNSSLGASASLTPALHVVSTRGYELASSEWHSKAKFPNTNGDLLAGGRHGHGLAGAFVRGNGRYCGACEVEH